MNVIILDPQLANSKFVWVRFGTHTEQFGFGLVYLGFGHTLAILLQCVKIYICIAEHFAHVCEFHETKKHLH